MQYSREALNTSGDTHRLSPVLEHIHPAPSGGMTHFSLVSLIGGWRELQSICLDFGTLQTPVPERCCMVILVFLSPQEHWEGEASVLTSFIQGIMSSLHCFPERVFLYYTCRRWCGIIHNRGYCACRNRERW